MATATTAPVPTPDTDNWRAILLMVLAMGVFALEDMFIKLASDDIGIGQILLLIGIGGVAFYVWLAWNSGAEIIHRYQLNSYLVIRSLSEVVAGYGFVTALTRIDISVASAILQATSLVTVLGAALFLREPIGWRRWTAIIVGFIGVLLIIRPGADAFDVDSLYALIAVFALAARDLVTRKIPTSIPTSIVALQAYVGIMLLGVGLMLILPDGDWQAMTSMTTIYIVIAAVCGIIAYFAITTSLRVGEASAVAPFRYSRLVFALIVGFVIFGEVPDLWMTLGSILIVGSGLYALYRERLRKISPKSRKPIPGPFKSGL
ncbi:MAG: DMT family transporter [Pseudomonadota bacterium]